MSTKSRSNAIKSLERKANDIEKDIRQVEGMVDKLPEDDYNRGVYEKRLITLNHALTKVYDELDRLEDE